MIPYIEQNCTITHEGKTFSSGGAVVTPDYIIAYVGTSSDDSPARDSAMLRPLTDWHGNKIGTCEFRSTWRINSCLSNRMYQIYATVDGKQFTGRGMGAGMSCRLRPVRRQSKRS